MDVSALGEVGRSDVVPFESIRGASRDQDGQKLSAVSGLAPAAKATEFTTAAETKYESERNPHHLPVRVWECHTAEPVYTSSGYLLSGHHGCRVVSRKATPMGE